MTAVLGICSLVIAAANAPAENSSMEQVSLSPSPIAHTADLEKAFWACDYFATTLGLDRTSVEFCGAVYEELKATKFGGDFEQLHKWWQDRKVEEHERLVAERY